MTDEQTIAIAHLKRVRINLQDTPVTERVSLQVSALAMLMDAVMTENPMAVQERVRITLRLLDQ